MRAMRGMTGIPRWRALVAAAVAIPSLLGVAAAPAHAGSARGPHPRPSAANPSVTGPVTDGKGAIVLATTAFDLRSVGYTQSPRQQHASLAPARAACGAPGGVIAQWIR